MKQGLFNFLLALIVAFCAGIIFSISVPSGIIIFILVVTIILVDSERTLYAEEKE